jgi:hypothetical protein
VRTKGRLAVAALAVAALAASVPLLNIGEASAGPAAQPLVLDLDLTPTGDCDGPVRGEVAVYHPSGVADGAEVEWRVRAGGATRTGTVVMEKSVATAEFTLDGPAGDIRVDTRLPGGTYGKVWRDRLTAGCDPVTVVSVGDSVVWDQGLDHDQKFPRLLAEKLGDATGRGFRNRDYSISGAVLDAPGLPAGGEDAGCRGERYSQDPDGDGEMELGEVTAQMPDVFCQLERAAVQAERAGEQIDLVVMNGCINDLDPFLGVGVGFTPGSEDVARGVERECSGIGAAAENPAKDVPYFSGAKVGYGGRGMRAAIEKAHTLPGRPKVVLVDFYFAMSRASLPVLRKQCDNAGLKASQLPRCYDAIGLAADRYEQFTRYSSEAYRVAAQAANAASPDGPYAVAADGLFTAEQAVLAPDAKLWGSPTADPAFPLRKQACPEFSPTVGQCLSAAIAHPNVEGARQYADNLALNPALRAWFGLGTTKAPVKVLAKLGGEVTLSAPATDGARYRWYFGDGTTAETGEPTVTHTYDGLGPALPRVLVNGVLHEALAPVAP